MKDLLFEKQLKGLSPYDSRTEDYVRKIKLGEVLKCEMSKPRNYEFHKKFFAMVSIVFDNIPHELEDKFKNQDDLITEFKLQTGWREKYVTLGGREIWIPKSISFSKMDNDEFEDFYNKCLDVVQKYIIHLIEREDLINAINEFSK